MVASRGLPVGQYGVHKSAQDESFFAELQEAESRRRQLALEIALKGKRTQEAPRTQKVDQTVADARALLEKRYGHIVRNPLTDTPPEPVANMERVSDWTARVAALRWRAHSERLQAEAERLKQENSTLRNVVSGKGIVDIAELSLLLQAKEKELFDLKRGDRQARSIEALKKALMSVSKESLMREVLTAWQFFVVHGVAEETGWFHGIMGWSENDPNQLSHHDPYHDPHHNHSDSEASDAFHTKLLKYGGLHGSDEEEYKTFGKEDNDNAAERRFAEMKRHLGKLHQGQSDTARNKHRPVPSKQQIKPTEIVKEDSPGPSLSARMEAKGENETPKSHHHHHHQDGKSPGGSHASASKSSESQAGGAGMWGYLGYETEPESEWYNVWGKNDTEEKQEARKVDAKKALDELTDRPWAPKRTEKKVSAFAATGHARTKRKPRPKKN